MRMAEGSFGDAIVDDGLARRLKALACTAPLHDLDARKVRLDWADAAAYQMAEVAFQEAAQITAWSGWQYLARTLPAERERVLASYPHLIDGVVLNNPDHLPRASEVLADA